MKQITFKTDEKIKAIAELASYIDSLEAGKVYTVTVEPQKKRRSLDANAYCWVLLDKIAAQLHESKEAVYRGYIKEVGGGSAVMSVKSEAVDKLCETWSNNGLGWQAETMPSADEGCTTVVLYYGSSSYDSAQMARLIDLIVQDCEIFGIETKDPAELERLVEKWGR